MSVPLAYDVVTDRVIAALEEGTVPWRRPWRANTDHPRNLEGRHYRGINVWMLLAQGYASPHWMTFHQAKAQGGFVRAGEHATPIVFWKQIASREDDSEKSRTIPLLRYYQVFNVEQVEGIAQPPLPDYPRFDPIERAEAIVTGMPNPPAMRREGNRAAYIPAMDTVVLPPVHQFTSADANYATLFHELGHSTGHASRLRRDGIVNVSKFGSMNYGREELVAEMTAAYLCGHSNILPATIDNTAAYLESWIQTIREDRRALVVAAAAAQRAADYILRAESDQMAALAGTLAA